MLLNNIIYGFLYSFIIPSIVQLQKLLNNGDYIPLIFEIITPIILFVKGGLIMIVFDRLWNLMKEKGVSTYKLREECGIDSKTIRRLKANENIETKTIDKLCRALDCRIQDIVEYIED